VAKNEPKRHHYVPEAYQRGFADTDDRLWFYDRLSRQFRKVHPRHICCERELYTINPDGDANQNIEAKYLSRIDGDGIEAIRLLEGPKP